MFSQEPIMSLPAHSSTNESSLYNGSQQLTVAFSSTNDSPIFLEDIAIHNLLTGIQSILLLEDKKQQTS